MNSPRHRPVPSALPSTGSAHLRASSWLFLILLTACTTTAPQITNVSHQRRLVNIGPADERIFARDSATHFKTEIRPVENPHEEFIICWRGANIRLVKLEYRQANQPNAVSHQTVETPQRQAARFVIGGSAFATGGSVSAWRASLWDETGALVAERKSALW